MSSTSDRFEALDRELLVRLEADKVLLDKTILNLRYSMAHPRPPIDMEEVMVGVRKQREESEQASQQHWDRVIQEERDGTLDEGSQVWLEMERKRRMKEGK